MNKPMRIYIAGPMRGIPSFNFPAFNAAAKRLREMGHEVFNPAEADVESDGFDPDKDEPKGMAHYMARDLPEVCRSNAVAVLPGWEKSRGACTEVYVARASDIPVLDVDTLQPIQTLSKSEVRVTDPNTGGQKGAKLERFDLLPIWPLQELARLYGRGALKYAPHNYLKGYDWGLSYAALGRHTTLFWSGESIDACGPDCPPDCKEHTNLHHLACAAWHCFALMMFEHHHLGTDTRWMPPQKFECIRCS